MEVDVQSLHGHRPLARHGSVGTVGHSLRVCSRPPPWEVRAATKPPHPPPSCVAWPPTGDPVAGWGRQRGMAGWLARALPEKAAFGQRLSGGLSPAWGQHVQCEAAAAAGALRRAAPGMSEGQRGLLRLGV